MKKLRLDEVGNNDVVYSLKADDKVLVVNLDGTEVEGTVMYKDTFAYTFAHYTLIVDTVDGLRHTFSD